MSKHGKQLVKALLLSFLLLQSTASAAPVMHLGTVTQLSPTHPVTLKLTEAYKTLGMDLQIEEMPLSRLRIEVGRGQLVDGTMAGQVGLEQVIPELLMVPVPLYQLELSAFVVEPRQGPRRWADLNGLNVTYLAGMVSVEQRLQGLQLKKALPVITLEQALRYVAKGRADVAVLPGTEADYVLARFADLKIQKVQPALEQLPMYHYIHRKHQALVKPLTEQLQRQQTAGSVTKLQQ